MSILRRMNIRTSIVMLLVIIPALSAQTSFAASAFDLTVQPSRQTVAPGMPTAFTVLVSSTGGFSAPVKLQVDNQASLPSSISAVFTPSTVTPPADGSGYAILVISTTTSTPTNVYSLTISGTGGGLTDSATVSLEVTTKSTFTVSASPFSQVIGLGYSKQFTVTVTSLGQFSSSVSLTLDQVPYGVSYSFDPSSVTPPPGSSAYATLIISVAADASPNVYALIIRASADGGLAASDRVHYSFVVVDVPATTGFQINLPSTTQTIVIGQPVSLTVEVDSIGGFSSDVVLALDRVPSGLSYAFDPPTVTPKPDSPATSTLRLTATVDATPGDYEVDVRGRSQGLSPISTIKLTVQPITTLTVSLGPAKPAYRVGEIVVLTMNANAPADYELTITKPDGTVWASATGVLPATFIKKATEPAGTYTAELSAQYSGIYAYASASFSVSLATYDVTISLAGLPSDATTTLYVDGTRGADMKGSDVRVLSYPVGTSYTFQVDQYVNGAAGYRYYCASNSWIASAQGSYTFNYVTQVYLDSNISPVGAGSLSLKPPSSDGWYNTGTQIEVTVLCVQAGCPGFVFSHWELDGIPVGTANPYTIVMSSPHQLTAVFSVVGIVTTETATSFSTETTTEVMHTTTTAGITETATSEYTTYSQSHPPEGPSPLFIASILVAAVSFAALVTIGISRLRRMHAVPPSPRICPHCGFRNPPYTRAFCVKCGELLEAPET